MQVVIIGSGKVGIALAEALLKREDDVVIVDQGDQWLERAKHLDCHKITGVVIDEDVLASADIGAADVVCAVTPWDNVNIMASLMARHVFSVPKVISRLYTPEKKRVFQELGLDTINSTATVVDAILQDIDGVSVLSRQELFGHQVEYHLAPIDDTLIGQAVQDIVAMDGQVVLGIVRRDELLPVSQKDVLVRGDQLVLVEVIV